MTWVERRVPWHRTEVAYCEVTGQLLPNRYWEFEADGRVVRARDPHCEYLYWQYVHKTEGEARERLGTAAAD